MRVPKLFKTLARKALLAHAEPTAATAEIYERIGQGMLAERTFYFGKTRLRSRSLAMEAAPGTAETIISALQGQPDGVSILDFGCGQHQSRYLRNMGFRVHSCDILDFPLDNFTRIDPASTRLPFADKQFDIVVASEVLEHVESPWEILAELCRVARDLVVVSSPNPANLHSREQFVRSGYLHWFAPENFDYHISPIFHWQMELFCQRHQLKLPSLLPNHAAFLLDDHGKPLEYAEALVYLIRK